MLRLILLVLLGDRKALQDLMGKLVGVDLELMVGGSVLQWLLP